MVRIRVLVTGGAGFIGSHVVDALIKRKARVSVVDNLSNGNKSNVNPRAKFYRADINSRSFKKAFEKEMPDVVVHLAAHISVRKSMENPCMDARENLMGSMNVLDLCRQYGTEKIVYSSTAAVYGEPRYLPVDEAHLIRPESPYGLSKACVEDYIRLYKKLYGLDYTILRYANVYGPRQNPEGEAGVISIFIDSLLKGRKPEIYGSGSQTRDFVYVEDAALATILGIRAPHGIYNIGSGKETSVNEIFSMIKEMTCSDAAAVHREPKQEVQRIYFSTERANEVLGWKPATTMKEGLEKTVKHFIKTRKRAR